MNNPTLSRLIFLALAGMVFSGVVSCLILLDITALSISPGLSIVSKLVAMLSFIVLAGYQVLMFRHHIVICQVAYLVSAALLLSLMGDIVNLNLGNHYYEQGPYIKHDYLVNSIWFFMPAYMCYCLAAKLGLRALGVSHTKQSISLLVAGIVGALSYMSLFNANANSYVIVLTALYSVVIALPLAYAYGFVIWATPPITLSHIVIAAGLVLATLADAIIGQFWLFADESRGYYPAVREWNWLIYCTSQACLSVLPLLVFKCIYNRAQEGA